MNRLKDNVIGRSIDLYCGLGRGIEGVNFARLNGHDIAPEGWGGGCIMTHETEGFAQGRTETPLGPRAKISSSFMLKSWAVPFKILRCGVMYGK